jgi:hypothetical protein
MLQRFPRYALAATATVALTLATAALVLTTSPTVRAQTDNGHYTCFPFTVDFFDDCTGEEIVGEGQICIASSGKVDNSGGLHVTFQFRSDFTAVGLTSGQTYTEHDSANETDNFNGNNPEMTSTFSQTYHVNTPGGKNNLALKELFHITVNANGEITAFNPDEFTFVCK